MGRIGRHSTDERGWETERCRMDQAPAPILDSTLAAELKCSHPRRVLEGKRTISGHWEYGRTCAFDACLESILLGVPPQNPFSTASTQRRHQPASRNGRYGIFGRDSAGHSALMLAAWITFAHLAVSVLITTANSSGKLRDASRPSCAKRSRMSACAAICAMSACTLPTMAVGVPAGANSPNHEMAVRK